MSLQLHLGKLHLYMKRFETWCTKVRRTCKARSCDGLKQDGQACI